MPNSGHQFWPGWVETVRVTLEADCVIVHVGLHVWWLNVPSKVRNSSLMLIYPTLWTMEEYGCVNLRCRCCQSICRYCYVVTPSKNPSKFSPTAIWKANESSVFVYCLVRFNQLSMVPQTKGRGLVVAKRLGAISVFNQHQQCIRQNEYRADLPYLLVGRITYCTILICKTSTSHTVLSCIRILF